MEFRPNRHVLSALGVNTHVSGASRRGSCGGRVVSHDVHQKMVDVLVFFIIVV
jgi:hypothetical protein